jgi:hypothetical protein
VVEMEVQEATGEAKEGKGAEETGEAVTETEAMVASAGSAEAVVVADVVGAVGAWAAMT